MSVETTLFSLLVVAGVVALIARRLHLPYTVTLVVAGLGLGALSSFGWLPDLGAVRLTPEVLFQVLLPILLFEAAFHISWSRFRANARAILLLAVPGVVLSVLSAGALTFVLEGAAGTPIPWAVALLLAAILAATDPVSVVALFKELGVPKRLAVIVEGESLLNDAVGVVAFTVCAGLLGIAPGGETIDAPWLAGLLLWEIGVGLLAGVGVGLLASWATTLVDDHLIEIMLTAIAAFGSYLLAEALHASPILAVVASGMACGNVAARYGMTPTNRIAVESFWEFCVFAANGLVFLLLGKEIELDHLFRHALPILVAWISLTVGRALVVLVVERVLSRSAEKMPLRWSAVLVWGGLRGALSMALALSLPESLPERGLVVDLTFGVVLLSILVQGPTMTPVLRWARAISGGSDPARYSRAKVALDALKAALVHLDKTFADGGIDEATHTQMRDRLAGREAHLENELAQLDQVEQKADRDLRRLDVELRDLQCREIRAAAERASIAPEEAQRIIDEIQAEPGKREPSDRASS